MRCQTPLGSLRPACLSVRSPAPTVPALLPGILSSFKISFKNLKRLLFSVNFAQSPSKHTVNDWTGSSQESKQPTTNLQTGTVTTDPSEAGAQLLAPRSLSLSALRRDAAAKRGANVSSFF